MNSIITPPQTQTPQPFEGPGVHADSTAATVTEAGDGYLAMVGQRLRQLRARRGMTRRILAGQSAISERHIAQLEGGIGNISILLLRRLAHALGADVSDLVSEIPAAPVDQLLIEQMLSRLSAIELGRARALLAEQFGALTNLPRYDRIALVGLRGGGKSSLGRRIAEARKVPFVELDREIEREATIELREIFELHGQSYFRKLERTVLNRLIVDDKPMVIATGGSLVTEAATFELLLANCLTVWIRASPEAHMRRVIEQGDLRPMQANDRAMEDLVAILESRSQLYSRADLQLDTSGRTLEQSLAELVSLVGQFRAAAPA